MMKFLSRRRRALLTGAAVALVMTSAVVFTMTAQTGTGRAQTAAPAVASSAQSAPPPATSPSSLPASPLSPVPGTTTPAPSSSPARNAALAVNNVFSQLQSPSATATPSSSGLPAPAPMQATSGPAVSVQAANAAPAAPMAAGAADQNQRAPSAADFQSVPTAPDSNPLSSTTIPGGTANQVGNPTGNPNGNSNPNAGPGNGQTALPSDDGVNPRAPGLTLSDPNAGAVGADPNDPFAAPPPPAPKTPAQIEAEIRARAYDAAVTGLLPMRPGEIRKLLETYDKTQQAVEVPVYPYPKPQVSVQTVSLDPGIAPLEIKTATGHVTTVNIMDVTGAPWPIQDMSWAGNFEIVQPESGGAVLRITPMSQFAYGNISIRLINLNTPITFVLKAHRDVVQYRFDARIPEYGPNSKPPIVQGSPSLSAGNSVMSAILEGVAPEGSDRLDVAGVDGRTSAYKYQDQTYVRTPLTLLSPGWSSSVSSGDGMNVYQLHDAPVVLLSEEGEVKRARLSERDAGK